MFHKKGPTLYELARQALSSTDQGYDLLAPKFDYTPFRTPDVMLDALLPFLGDPEDALDICCGTGAGARLLAKTGAKVTGVDRSEGMLEEARRRWTHPHQAEFIQGDALSLPFHGQFDVATCFGAFGHIERHDEPRFARQVQKALKTGGRFVFISGRMPPLTSPARWMAHGFNGVMRVRNALIKPEFIMYYLTFLVPDCVSLFRHHGFDVEVHEDVFAAPFHRACVVVATKR